MSSSAYNGFFISARAVMDRPTLWSRTPMTTISITEGGDSIMGIYSTDAFSNDEDAEAYGIRMAEEWIDKNLRVTPLVKREIDRDEKRAVVMVGINASGGRQEQL